MGARRLTIAAVLLGAFSLLTAVFAAPVVLNVAYQPDSTTNLPGGILVVEILDGNRPISGANVSISAVDGSWTETCSTDSYGLCAFDPLPGAKGTVTAGNATRAFFLPQSQFGRWDRNLGEDDEGAPIGLGPVDALPSALVLVASLFGFAAAISMWKRASARLALLGVGLSLLAHLWVFLPMGLAIAGFAGYALVKDAAQFGTVPLDDVDTDEEEE